MPKEVIFHAYDKLVMQVLEQRGRFLKMDLVSTSFRDTLENQMMEVASYLDQAMDALRKEDPNAQLEYQISNRYDRFNCNQLVVKSDTLVVNPVLLLDKDIRKEHMAIVCAEVERRQKEKQKPIAEPIAEPTPEPKTDKRSKHYRDQVQKELTERTNGNRDAG